MATKPPFVRVRNVQSINKRTNFNVCYSNKFLIFLPPEGVFGLCRRPLVDLQLCLK